MGAASRSTQSDEEWKLETVVDNEVAGIAASMSSGSEVWAGRLRQATQGDAVGPEDRQREASDSLEDG